MKTHSFIVEKTDTGYSAYSKDENAITTGGTIAEVKQNALESLNLLFEHKGEKTVTAEQIILELDLSQFFEYYKVINAKAFSERIGINPQLLNHYIKGQKKPGVKQVSKIAQGLRELGRELQQVDFA